MSDDDQLTPHDADLLTAYLSERDEPCPLCGYNLRNLTSNRCPECGDFIRLSIVSIEPRLAAYITTLVACCLGFGGGTLFGIVVLIRAPSYWWSTAAARVLLAQWVVSAALLPYLLARRRRFRGLSRRAQWLLAVGACVLFASLSAMFVLLFDP